MNCHSTIHVHELLGSSIHTREASSVLMRLVETNLCDHVEFDFTSVVFISGSFADQFHFDKTSLAIDLQKNIIVSNASENVINMLQAVTRSQKAVNREIEKVPVYKYSSQHQLENFLLSF